MGLKFLIKDQNIVVKVEGEIDHHSSQFLKDKIDMQIHKENVKNIIFDFAGVNFMDSSGLGLVMGRYRTMQSLGGRVMLTNISSQLDRVFSLAGLYRVMDKYEDVDQALKAL